MKYRVNTARATWRILDGEAVIINNETSYYYSLNTTGTFVWNLLLENDMGLDEIIRRVSLHYGQDEAAIADDVRSIIENLYNEKLIERR